MGITFKAPCVETVKLENLWFQLSNVACNIKCRHCFLDCHHDTKKKNFLSVEKIVEALKTDLKDLKMIYLTGGEPFFHSKINDILKLCLKKADVTVCTNGTLLNDKKFKILKALVNDSKHKLYFKFSLDHFTEGRNDEYRAHGVFKKVVNALKLAQNYDMKSAISCVNLKRESEDILNEGFINLFNKHKLNMSINDVKIVPMLKIGSYAKYHSFGAKEENVTFEDFNKIDIAMLDCKNSRVVTINGIYSCPALVNDPRGKLGDSLKDCVNNVYLETQTCYDCISMQDKLFG